MAHFVPFAEFNRPLSLRERGDLERLIRRNTTGIPVVAPDEIHDYLLALAQACEVTLDREFPQAATRAAELIGEANPKVPDPTCQAPMRLAMRDKLPKTFPLLSALSAPPARRFDFTGAASAFRAASLLCAAVADEEGRVRTLAEDILEGGPFAAALAELTSSENSPDLREALKRRLDSAGQVSHVHPGEKQLYVPGGEGRYLMVTPLSTNLPIELHRRIHERRARSELFGELRFHVGGENPINCGLSAAMLGGDLPKLMCLAPEIPAAAAGDARYMPATGEGRYLVLRVDVSDLNATGTDVAAGFSLLTTAALGFSDALRLKALGDVKIEAVAIGVSSAQFRGEWRGDRWVYSQKCGVKTTARGVSRMPVPELNADAVIHLVLRLDRDVSSEAVDANQVLGMTRLGGGRINSNLPWAVVDDKGLSDTLAAWRRQVVFLADRSDWLSEGEPLDRLLDAMAIKEDPVTGRWHRAHPGLLPVAAGYQGLEPPRPRSGLRGAEAGVRHIYAVSMTTLAEFVPASAAAEDAVWWGWEWRRASFSAALTGRKHQVVS